MEISNFIRIEKKYLLKKEKYEELLNTISSHFIPDSHGRSTILSLYLDTPNFEIIRNSIEAVNYKEKLRLRSYGTPSLNNTVFLEIKKKFDGVVYKRREEMTLNEAINFINTGTKPLDSQIMNELDYSFKRYDHPKGACLISYERDAYYSKINKDLRITFDRNIRYRTSDLKLEMGSYGKPIINDDEILMEIKTGGAMPFWLADVLNNLKIYPSSFSKYGTAYKEIYNNSLI